jgi:hypothetical protein
MYVSWYLINYNIYLVASITHHREQNIKRETKAKAKTKN